VLCQLLAGAATVRWWTELQDTAERRAVDHAAGIDNLPYTSDRISLVLPIWL